MDMWYRPHRHVRVYCGRVPTLNPLLRYLSTAEDHRVKQQKYKLLPDKVLIKLSTIIQEVDLKFQHEGRTGTAADSAP